MEELFNAVLNDMKIQKGLKYIQDTHPESIEEHKKFIACEAPTFQEANRAELYKNKLEENGITDITVDDYGNVYGYRKGTGNGSAIFVEAHMDTVFPMGSVKEIRDEDGIIYAPGATDNTRGVTAILAALRAMNEAGIKTKADIIFGGTSREEGFGSLGGMRDFIQHGPKISASVSVDGASTEAITCEATGYRTYEVTFRGQGGHAYTNFGDFGNVLHAAARAVAKIADFTVPEEPKTTFCVSNFHAGTTEGAHAMVDTAVIIFNIRSNSQELLDELDANCFKAIDEACEEESDKFGGVKITWEKKIYCDVPAGKQDHSLPIVQAALTCAKHFSVDESKVSIRQGGCVNGNRAIAAGIPCVTIGGGPLNCKIHSLEEYFPYTEAYRLPQEILVLLSMLAGIDGVTEPLIDR